MNIPSQNMLNQLYGAHTHIDEASIVPLLRQYAEPLPELNSQAFGEMFDRYADARVVMIGEASHGTSDFYRTRAAITQRLIEQHGFNIVAVEADWPDAGHVDRYARGLARSAWTRHIFSRFPTWMWRNTDVKAFTHWLHQYNHQHAPEQRVEFRGLDVYSLRNSIHEVLSYLDRVDPQLAHEARRRYGCLSPWQDDPALYGHFVERDGIMPCEHAVVEQLNAMLAEQLAGAIKDDEAFSMRPGTPGSSRRRNNITERFIEVRRPPGTCATGTCSTRYVRCSNTAALKPKLWCGRTTPISAMRPPRKWAGRVSSISVNCAAMPMGAMWF